LDNINVRGSAFNAFLCLNKYTEAEFDNSTMVIKTFFGMFAECWITLQWAYCCKIIQNKKDAYCFIRVECIFEVWAACLLEHVYDLETHKAKRL